MPRSGVRPTESPGVYGGPRPDQSRLGPPYVFARIPQGSPRHSLSQAAYTATRAPESCKNIEGAWRSKSAELQSNSTECVLVSVPHVEAQGQTARLEAARDGSVAGSLAAAGLEESLWLCPIEDRRELDSSREGMMDGISLGSYARLVDYTGRLFRPGKAMISAGLAEIFERLGSNTESWRFRMDKLRKSQLPGRFFAASQAKLKRVAEHFNVRSVVNLAGCPAR
jgi:hypothetical protein